jgi:Flp pilus assembly pilin Flp
MNHVQTAIDLLRAVVAREDGQDLVEYSLVFALIAFGSITGMGQLASGINNVFSSVGSTLTTNV